jgi:hypothetical protein
MVHRLDAPSTHKWNKGTLKGLTVMAVSVNLAKALDKEFEDKSLKEILDASPAALAGITDAKADALKELLGIKTIRELGSNKYFATAGVLVALENKAG